MAAITTPPAETGEHILVPVWAWAVLAVGLLASYVMLQENGLLMNSWMTVHEFFHDGRHGLGFPCH
jgi:Probable cobalt transporter subunit (CbtB)